MTQACKDCDIRIMYAKAFDVHFSGADCPYECEYATDNANAKKEQI